MRPRRCSYCHINRTMPWAWHYWYRCPAEPPGRNWQTPCPLIMDRQVRRLARYRREFAKNKPVPPAPPAPAELTKLETMLRTYFGGKQSPSQQSRLRPVRRNWSDVKCFSCGKTGNSATRCPMLDVTFPFILPVWKAEKTSTGDGPPAGGKRRLIRREGFASRISKNARPHDPGGGGGQLSPRPSDR